MKEFVYEISFHPLQVESKMRIFCSAEGDCSVEDVPDSDSMAVIRVLNERGRDGWELIEILFGRDGYICFWKREMGSQENTSWKSSLERENRE
jgi:hypothetical protein